MRDAISSVAKRWLRWTTAMLAAGVLCHSPSIAAADTPLPAPWQYADVGAVGIAGSAAVTDGDGSFTVRAAGADIWGTSDSFGYVYQPFVGDGWISVFVSSLQNTNTFAKVGLMLRESLDPGSPHVIVDLRPTGDIEFMRRPSAGAATEYLSGFVHNAPIGLVLYRNGSSVSAYAFSGVGDNFFRIGTTTIAMGRDLLVGIPVTSHDTTVLTMAKVRPPFTHTYSFGLPDPSWQDSDVGAVGLSGGTTYENGVYTVRGAGADIWGTADAFHFVGRGGPGSGPGELIARVTSLENTDTFAKAGIDVRLGRGVSPSDAHVILDVRPTGDIEFMVRTRFGEATTYLGGAVQQTPVWLKLTRSNTTITGWVSADGEQWTTVGDAHPDFDQMNAGDGWVSAGLVVSSHDTSRLNTATFDHVALEDVGSTLPRGWTNADVGDTGDLGSALWKSRLIVQGAGSDVWGTADSFQFVSQFFNACCEDISRYPLQHIQVTARVMSIENTNPFAKAGVMIRTGRPAPPFPAGTDANAAHVILDVRPTGDIELMTRPSAGAPTTYIAGATATLPVWLRLVRVDDVVTGSFSSDGTTWTTVGSTTTGVSSDFTVAGVVVTSHVYGQKNTSTFDQVDVRIPQ